MSRRPLAGLAALIAGVAMLAGCQVVVDPPQTVPDVDATTSVEARAGGDVVPLEIAEGDGSTLAFVPITINGEGPFPFALDTGAARTAISSELVEQLALPDTGRTEQVSGVVGVTEAPLVEVSDWRLGEVDLGAIELVAFEIGPGPVQIGGLLGSDVLERFGRVTVDYEQGVLILGE